MAKHRRYHTGERIFRPQPIERLPQILQLPGDCKRIVVEVEGYEDVAFWRGVLDPYESSRLRFDISVPLSYTLAKGKKTLLARAAGCNEGHIMCMDSDFDYLFADQTADARIINSSPYLFHTYVYSTENFVCYAPSLHNICVKATKNDTKIFDFERFFADYSRAIYPAFVWYAYSAQISTPNIFTLPHFKNTVRLGYLDLDRGGADTLEWLRRQVAKRIRTLETEYPTVAARLDEFEVLLRNRGVTPEQTYLFMHGHTLMDNVVTVVLDAVCSKLRLLSGERIRTSGCEGQTLLNEQSNYTNSLSNVRDVLLYNENYRDCFLYRNLQRDIEHFLESNHLG